MGLDRRTHVTPILKLLHKFRAHYYLGHSLCIEIHEQNFSFLLLPNDRTNKFQNLQVIKYLPAALSKKIF
jgi:hypothetical protein